MRLLYKELTLAAHPTSIVFAFLGCLVIVPAYPYTVIFMYGFPKGNDTAQPQAHC